MGRAEAEIAVIGLAVMGQNLARNIARRGFAVAVHNRSAARTTELLERHGDEGTFLAAGSLEELVGLLARPRKVLVMVRAGAPVDGVLDELVPLLEPGDVVIDGGNSHFQDTRRRAQALAPAGVHLLGTGVSGGEEGALRGPSIMAGGAPEAYAAARPVLEAIAARVDGEPCCAHVGGDGAGHFVKMVHNGIEYADMQLIAEAYDLLRHGLAMEPAQLAAVFEDWNAGDLESFLVEITAAVLRHVDRHTGRPFVDVVVDQAEQKGTGRWTVQSALELGVPTTGIAEAVFARVLSGGSSQRAAVQAAGLVGPSGPAQRRAPEQLVDDVRKALYASKVVAYAQGFQQIAAAAERYGWQVDLGAVARIWRGGCIIRARFLDRIAEAYADEPDLQTLLAAEYFRDAVSDAQDAWRRVVVHAVELGVPAPGFSSSLAYYDALRRDRLPTALLQGLRDLFGAHTYRRVDRPGSFHTQWALDGSEVPVGVLPTAPDGAGEDPAASRSPSTLPA